MYESLLPYIFLYVHGFLCQNSQNHILRLLLDIWKSGSVCEERFIRIRTDVLYIPREMFT